ncbi:Hypothetical predicted protein [Cloeon dipterum]|uniref:Uncharacterized protein n=1 Tax=Cloeon dipterum TaxID=197152 RepID=A0A8S1DNA4_9INSE|nr:Hypothetical predicted protein [Cloeon dipterum]
MAEHEVILAGEEPQFFEGVEKLLEVWFTREDGRIDNCNLRKIPRSEPFAEGDGKHEANPPNHRSRARTQPGPASKLLSQVDTPPAVEGRAHPPLT